MNLALNDDGIAKSRDTSQVVTICLPLEIEGKNPDGNRIRLKNLISESLERLKAQNLDSMQRAKVQAALEQVHSHQAFAQGDSSGVMITLKVEQPAESVKVRPLSFAPIPLTALNPHPILTPTVRDRQFTTTIVLCLTEGGAKAYKAYQYELEGLEIGAETSTKVSTGREMTHEIGRRLLRQSHARTPILLAGSEELLSVFKINNPELNYLPYTLNREACQLSRGQLKKKVDTLLALAQDEHAERMLSELVDGPPERKLTGLNRIARSLQSGEVQTLFLNPVFMGDEVVERMARLADSMGADIVFVKSMTARQKAIAQTRW